MFKQPPFKYGIIKNTIIAFGALFGGVQILRHDSDGRLSQTVAVPITYGPKEKIFVRMRQDPDLNNQVMVTLPRMAFEITGMQYDQGRATNKFQKIACAKPDGTVLGTFAPVPYDLNIQLNILTKGTEDGLDIIEQILPNFMPNYILRVQALKDMNMPIDVPISLNGVSIMDEYEGSFEQGRLVTHTLDFTAKIALFGAIGEANVITRTDTAIQQTESETVITKHQSTGDKVTKTVTSDFWT